MAKDREGKDRRTNGREERIERGRIEGGKARGRVLCERMDEVGERVRRGG